MSTFSAPLRQRVVESRPAVLLFGLLMLSIPACDSTSEDSQVTFAVTLEGSGSGRVEARSISLGLDINCRITNGEVTGVCEDTFIPPDNDGFIRVQATPAPAMDFEWGPQCSVTLGTVCDVRFEVDGPPEFGVRATFDVQTDRVVMEPPNAAITVPGEEGAVTVSARAVDENGNEVAGVAYTFEVDRTDVVSMTAQSASSVRITALADGQAIVTATAQGVSGTSAIDVMLAN